MDKKDMIRLIETEDDINKMDRVFEQLAGHGHASGDFIKLGNVYDAIRQLKHVLLGSMDEHWEEAGAFRVFEQVFEIINNATSSKIKFLGDEIIDKIMATLNNETMKPEERAKQLLGME